PPLVYEHASCKRLGDAVLQNAAVGGEPTERFAAGNEVARPSFEPHEETETPCEPLEAREVESDQIAAPRRVNRDRLRWWGGRRRRSRSERALRALEPPRGSQRPFARPLQNLLHLDATE